MSVSRLNRMLATVPYFLAHPGASTEQAARDLATSPAQVQKDLQLLWMCGLPGYGPGELIDLEYGDSGVSIVFSAGIERPLRPTPREAAVLLTALQVLAASGGAVDKAATTRAIAKLEAALGTLPAASPGSAAEPGSTGSGSTGSGSAGSGTTAGQRDARDDESPMAQVVRDAVRTSRALRMSYYSASRDAVGERVVDPIRIQVVDSAAYLEAWCRSSEDVRLFRLDRIEDARVLDEPAAVPVEAAAADSLGLLTGTSDAFPTATIEIDRGEIWVLDHYMIELLDPAASGSDDSAPVRAVITYGSTEWFIRFLLGFGGRIRVIDDPDIAATVTRRSVDAVAQYR